MTQPEEPSSNPISENANPGQYRVVPAGKGSKWLSEGIQLVKSSPAPWLGISAFLIFMFLIPGMNYLVGFLMPAALGGIMLGCAANKQNENFKFDHLFAGLKQDRKELLILSAIYASGSILINLATLLILFLIGIDYQQVVLDLTPPQGELTTEKEALAWVSGLMENNTLLYLLLGILISLALMIPLFMAIWFSPALIVLHKISAFQAIKISFGACKDNFMPFLFFGFAALAYLMITYFIIFIAVAIIPILGVPLMIFSFVAAFAISLSSIYTAYQDIFNTHSKIKESDDSASMLA